MMKINPVYLLLGATVGAVVLAAVFGGAGGESNLHTYRTLEDYGKAVELPEDSMIVVVAYDDASPLSSNVLREVVSIAMKNPTVHYVVVSPKVGTTMGMDLDGVWGRVDAGHDDESYTAGFGPDTTAADVKVHLQAATATVKAGAA